MRDLSSPVVEGVRSVVYLEMSGRPTLMSFTPVDDPAYNIIIKTIIIYMNNEPSAQAQRVIDNSFLKFHFTFLLLTLSKNGLQ